MSFGERLKDARRSKGLTQKELADIIGARHNSVSNWESDRNKPDTDTIELLCRVLNVSPSHLIRVEKPTGMSKIEKNTDKEGKNSRIYLKPDTKVLFFGDSITDGGRGRSMDGNHIMGHGYQYIVSSKLALDNIENMPKFINKGISGEDIFELYSRLFNDVIKNEPDIVSILVGVNDIGKRVGLPHGEITKRYITTYNMMVEDIKKYLPDTKIIICEPFRMQTDNYKEPYKNTPYAMCEQYVNPLNIEVSREELDYCNKELEIMQKELFKFAMDNNLIFVPIQEELNRYVQIVPCEYLVWDTVHPTIAGHEIIARQWLKVVEESL